MSAQGSDPCQCHVKGARNGGRRKGQHIYGGEQLLELFFLSNTEALLLVNNQKTEITEFDFLAEQLVGADKNINAACCKLFLDFCLLLRRAEA